MHAMKDWSRSNGHARSQHGLGPTWKQPCSTLPQPPHVRRMAAILCSLSVVGTDWWNEYDRVQRAAYHNRQRARERDIRVLGGPVIGIAGRYGGRVADA